MKGFNYIWGETLMRVLAQANELHVKKEEFVCLTEENGYVCLVYYDSTGNWL